MLGQPQITSTADEPDYRVRDTYFKMSRQLVMAINMQFLVSSSLAQ